MPIHETAGGGEQWGGHGTVYRGKGAHAKAAKQAAAAYANGYRDDCAGTLFASPGPKYLLMHRSDRDEWEGPGGHLEADESAETAALRETEEETGFRSNARPKLIDAANGYTLYGYDVDAPFRPALNHEHHEWGWFGADELPETTHPQLRRVIAGGARTRADAALPNETEVIEKLKRGELDSPVRFGPLWLFKMRVTGTGVAYRPDHNEWVYRPPRYYLTEKFLNRVNGLPVLTGHPKVGPVSGEEYHARSIGILVHPWIDGEEVMGIAKIYDDDDAAWIVNHLTSTSPSVTFGPGKAGGELVDLENGEKLFIEGDPFYVDHLAVVQNGVWDKYDGSNGINLSALTGANR